MKSETSRTVTGAQASTTLQRSLAALMQESDELDVAIVGLLEQPFRCSRAIGAIKAATGQPKFDPSRVKEQHARFVELCRQAVLDAPICETPISGSSIKWSLNGLLAALADQ